MRVAHRGLAQRTLSAVGNRFVALPRKTIEPASESEVVAEVGKIREKLVPYVRQLLDPLFMLFEFQQFDEAVYTDIVRRFERGEST